MAQIESYARSFNAPVREGVLVTSVERDPSGTGFLVRTDDGMYTAPRVVIATGALQRPFIPESAAGLPSRIAQFVPYTYRNPAALPPGAVLWWGAANPAVRLPRS